MGTAALAPRLLAWPREGHPAEPTAQPKPPFPAQGRLQIRPRRGWRSLRRPCGGQRRHGWRCYSDARRSGSWNDQRAPNLNAIGWRQTVRVGDHPHWDMVGLGNSGQSLAALDRDRLGAALCRRRAAHHRRRRLHSWGARREHTAKRHNPGPKAKPAPRANPKSHFPPSAPRRPRNPLFGARTQNHVKLWCACPRGKPATSGTKRTGPRSSVKNRPPCGGPAGAAGRGDPRRPAPPGCRPERARRRGRRHFRAAAVTMMRSNGACSGQPLVPSPKRHDDVPRRSSSNRRSASRSSSRWRSIVKTRRQRLARTAAW